MSSSNCCFLTCIQISQETGQVVWYSHLFQNFPQFVVIHTVKGFGVVNEAEIDVFSEFSCIFYDPVDVGIWSLVPLPFLNPAWIGSSQFKYCWSLAWRNLSITLLACEMFQLCGSLNTLWHCFSLGLELNWPFPVLWPLLGFPILLAYWWQHFNIIIFYVLKSLNWNSITSTNFLHNDAS